MAEPRLPVTISFCGSCPNCRHALPPLNQISAQYFESGSIPCAKCQKPVDIWQSAQSCTKGGWLSFVGLQALGAHLTFCQIQLSPGELKEIDFTSHGVPEGARVLNVNYNPQGGTCFPLEWHGNVPRRRIIGTKLSVYGMPLKGRNVERPINVMVTWIHRDESTEAWLCLVDAFEAIASGQFSKAIVPANSAVEISLLPTISAVLKRYSSKEKVRTLVENEMSYSSALNVILPLLCGSAGVPHLPDRIRGALNHLRSLRNDYLHEGIQEGVISEEVAAELLCAAVFGFEYMRYVRARLLG